MSDKEIPEFDVLVTSLEKASKVLKKEYPYRSKQWTLGQTISIACKNYKAKFQIKVLESPSSEDKKLHLKKED